jgi:cell fate regulator YaaT (PSP1 superfamily)
MACNSCGTGKDGAPSGCRSNGTCGTGGCNKLNVYNWLSDMVLPHGQAPFPIVEVRFKGSRKEFYRNADNVELRVGDLVALEASPGHDVGVVSMVGELVRFQLRKKGVEENSDIIKALYRKAKPSEVEKYNEVKDKENSTLHRTREIIQSLKLSMKLSDVEYQGDGKKATFFYTADDRVDFRELIKKLAEEFRIRVEMRQIGMRQEAARLGGIGVCGRELCCSTWLSDFKTVSTSTARYQNLALNPAKLAGQCTKLKCCLNYELDSYMDALKDFPSTNIILETEKGRAFHRKTDIFKRLLWYAFTIDEKKEQRELIEGGVGGNWVMLSVDRVNEIINLNKQKIRPTDLALPVELEEVEVLPDYENVVGQDRIDRMDKLKKKKKKKKPSGGGGNAQVATAEGAPASNQARPQNPNQQRRPDQKQNPNQARPQNPNQQNQGPRPQNQPNANPNQQKNNQPRPQNQGNQNPNQQRTPNPNQQNQGQPRPQNPNQQRPQQNQPNKNNPPAGNQSAAPANPQPPKPAEPRPDRANRAPRQPRPNQE